MHATLAPGLAPQPRSLPGAQRGREPGGVGYREMFSPRSHLHSGDRSTFSASMEAEGAELAMPLVASDFGATLREREVLGVPPLTWGFLL